VPGAGHTGAFRTKPEAYINAVAGFFKTHLGRPKNHLPALPADDSAARVIIPRTTQLPENSNN
jgi:hypothetical protein